MIEEECRSGLRLDNIYFSHIECTRKQIIEKTTLSVNYQVNCNVDNNVSIVEIKTDIVAQNEGIHLILITNGQFTLVDDDNEYSDETKQDMLRLSTVSVMMPYIRSQVSLITTQPDLTPIILQPVDVTRLMAQQQEQN